jgi:hypothetical protein
MQIVGMLDRRSSTAGPRSLRMRTINPLVEQCLTCVAASLAQSRRARVGQRVCRESSKVDRYTLRRRPRSLHQIRGGSSRSRHRTAAVSYLRRTTVMASVARSTRLRRIDIEVQWIDAVRARRPLRRAGCGRRSQAGLGRASVLAVQPLTATAGGRDGSALPFRCTRQRRR